MIYDTLAHFALILNLFFKAQPSHETKVEDLNVFLFLNTHWTILLYACQTKPNPCNVSEKKKKKKNSFKKLSPEFSSCKFLNLNFSDFQAKWKWPSDFCFCDLASEFLLAIPNDMYLWWDIIKTAHTRPKRGFHRGGGIHPLLGFLFVKNAWTY